MLFLIIVSLCLHLGSNSSRFEIKIKIISKDTWLEVVANEIKLSLKKKKLFEAMLLLENNLKILWIKCIAERLRNCSVSCIDTQYLGYSAFKHELSNQHKRHAIATLL